MIDGTGRAEHDEETRKSRTFREETDVPLPRLGRHEPCCRDLRWTYLQVCVLACSYFIVDVAAVFGAPRTLVRGASVRLVSCCSYHCCCLRVEKQYYLCPNTFLVIVLIPPDEDAFCGHRLNKVPKEAHETSKEK